MARKRLEVTLTPDEHESLSTYVAHGHKSAREINRARILLLAHDGHTDADIATVLGVSHVTIYNMRKSIITKAISLSWMSYTMSPVGAVL